jgi:hypothetical protein
LLQRYITGGQGNQLPIVKAEQQIANFVHILGKTRV